MQKYILSKNDVIGKVEKYVIQYESQFMLISFCGPKKKMLKALEKELLHL
jgi:hypothetical protein